MQAVVSITSDQDILTETINQFYENQTCTQWMLSFYDAEGCAVGGCDVDAQGRLFQCGIIR